MVSFVDGQAATDRRVQEHFGIDEFEFVDLAISAGLPEALIVVLPRPSGRSWRLELEKKSLRGGSFRVRLCDAGGQYTEIAPPAVRTYRGGVRGIPRATVTAHRRPDGLWARIRLPDGRRLRIHPVRECDPSSPARRHVVFDEPDEVVDCGVCDDCPGSTAAGGVVGAGPGPLGAGTSCELKTCQIAFDCDYEYFLLNGSNVGTTVSRVETLLAEVEAFYVRDLLVTYELTDVVVRTAPFYLSTGGGSLLDLFRQEWTTTLAATPRDIAHLMTNKSDLSGYAGLAWVGVVCNQSLGYGWSVDSAGVIGHEVGHNWNASHCHDVAPCNNMCGACLNIAPSTLDIMKSFKSTRTCLTDAGAYPTPVEPYGHRDRVILTEGELLSGVLVPIDVLANDHDANCDALAIVSHDSVSEKGGSVVLSFGAGMGGTDALVYIPPPGGFAGNDRFQYVLGDGTFEIPTEVVVHVNHPVLEAHWRLDELEGSLAADSSGHDHTGTVQSTTFGTSSSPGVFAGSLNFGGVGSAVTIPRPDLYTDTLTVTAWLKRDGVQSDWAGVLVTRSRSTNVGLTLGPDDDLRYLWGDGGWEFDPNLTLPDDEWVFVAMAVTPTDVTLYLGDPDALQSATYVRSHAVQPFDGAVHIGFDAANDSRRFKGDIDDVRLFRYALTAEEVSLVGRGDRARAPLPGHLKRGVSREAVLAIDPSSSAAVHRFYLGSTSAAVSSAGVGDSEFRGELVEPFFDPGLLAAGGRYFWRVDEVTAEDTFEGATWEFETGTTLLVDALRVHYSCDVDEFSGSVLFDSSPAPVVDAVLDGAMIVPDGYLLGGLSFDGFDDRVEVPPLDLDTNTLTVSAWLRRSGDQADWAGIFFSRSGGTVAGLNFGTHNELRYHWEDGHWGWDSGLEVPDGEWAHVALVIEPYRATIYLNGVRAIRQAQHLPEEFDGVSYLGQDPTSTARHFEGELDDVALWSRSLTAEEVRAVYRRGTLGQSFQAAGGPAFIRGDANADGLFDIADTITTLDWLFAAGSAQCVLAMDSNDDDVVDIGDVITSLDAIFSAAGPLVAPHPACGVDPTPGTLSCATFAGCP